MKVVWTVVPIGNGEFRLVDHHGKRIGVFTRRLEIWFAGFEYIDAHRGEDGVDEVVFEGIDRIPSFVERWKRRFARLIP